MTHISLIDNPRLCQLSVSKSLGTRGIKLGSVNDLIAQRKTHGNSNEDISSLILGVPLQELPNAFVDDCGFVPRFLVEAASTIRSNLSVEGIFRKSGSIVRQKEILRQFTKTGCFVDAHAHDVGNLVKRFLREMPEPLFIEPLQTVFVRAKRLGDDDDRRDSILMLCLLLPACHLATLQYLVQLMADVACSSEENLMDAYNLAVVMAPNLFHDKTVDETGQGENQLLAAQTAIVQLLIENASAVGVVCAEVLQRLDRLALEQQAQAALDAQRDGGAATPKRRSSLKGLVGAITSFARRSGIGGASPSSRPGSRRTSGIGGGAEAVRTAQAMSEADIAAALRSGGVTPRIMTTRKRRGDDEAIVDSVLLSAAKRRGVLGAVSTTPMPSRFQFTPNAAPSMAFAANAPSTTSEAAPFLGNKETQSCASKTRRRSSAFLRFLAGKKRSKDVQVDDTKPVPLPIHHQPTPNKSAAAAISLTGSKRIAGSTRITYLDSIDLTSQALACDSPVLQKRRPTPSSNESSTGSDWRQMGRYENLDGSFTAYAAEFKRKLNSQTSDDGSVELGDIEGFDWNADDEEEMTTEDEPFEAKPVDDDKSSRAGRESLGGKLRRGRPNTLTSGLPAALRRTSDLGDGAAVEQAVGSVADDEYTEEMCLDRSAARKKTSIRVAPPLESLTKTERLLAMRGTAGGDAIRDSFRSINRPTFTETNRAASVGRAASFRAAAEKIIDEYMGEFHMDTDDLVSDDSFGKAMDDGCDHAKVVTNASRSTMASSGIYSMSSLGSQCTIDSLDCTENPKGACSQPEVSNTVAKEGHVSSETSSSKKTTVRIPMTPEVETMLRKAGYDAKLQSDERSSSSTTSPVVRAGVGLPHCESIRNIREAAPVSAQRALFEVNAAAAEPTGERRRSGLVRIPTVFAKADSTAAAGFRGRHAKGATVESPAATLGKRLVRGAVPLVATENLIGVEKARMLPPSLQPRRTPRGGPMKALSRDTQL